MLWFTDIPRVLTFAINVMNFGVAGSICVDRQNQVIQIHWKDLRKAFPACR